MHPGETRTEATIAQHFYWKGMRTTVLDACKKCDNVLNKESGKLPPKSNVEQVPWHTLCVDLIGPYKVGEDISRTRNKITKIVRSADLTVHDYDRSCYRMVRSCSS
jgi:hypothetical protein